MLSVLIASESLTLPACRVRDNVFSASACSALHDEASALGRSKHLLHRGSPRSVLEQALDSFLDEVDDPDRYVEYWTRQQWVHLEAHADVDEALCAATGCGDQPGALPRTLVYPEHGHVLYLSVGPKVRGPTCVWDASAGGGGFGALTTVPAVAGRVLRFDGTLQHAVPRPSDVWLSGGQAYEEDPEDAKGEYLRSVVLFNTWAEPPQDVEPLESAPLAAAAADADSDAAVRCAPQAEWVDAPGHAPAGAHPSAAMSIWLLGDEARRSAATGGDGARTVTLPVDGELAKAALQEKSRCTTFDEAARVPPKYLVDHYRRRM